MPVSSAAYDTVTTVLNAARMRLNDDITTLQPIGGKLLKNTQPFSQEIVNMAWRKLQGFLANLGYSGLKTDAYAFVNLPAVGTADPAILCFINFQGGGGYWNGTTFYGSFVLPADLIRPLDVWERVTGTNAIMTEMDYVINGLPAVPKANWNRQWEWRNDILFFPGALVATDMRIRYTSYYGDFADAGQTPWYQAQVPIMRCVDAFADYCCREVCIARGDMEGAVAFQSSAEAAAQLIVNRDMAQPEAISKASEAGKMRDKFTPLKNPGK